MCGSCVSAYTDQRLCDRLGDRKHDQKSSMGVLSALEYFVRLRGISAMFAA